MAASDHAHDLEALDRGVRGLHRLEAPGGTERQDGHAKFGRILPSDAEVLAAMGTGHNVPNAIFTMDGKAAHFPSNSDHFPDVQTNVVPIQESMGAYNAMEQLDVHSYWEFNYRGSNWIHPLYELPFTGGLDDDFAQGKIGKLQSIVPGSGPSGVQNDPTKVGDNPYLARRRPSCRVIHCCGVWARSRRGHAYHLAFC